MLQFCSLYSGSSGNSFLVKSDHSTILIDSGVSLKKMICALDQLDICANHIDGILVTHEHIDHTKSLGMLSSKYNIPVFANQKTWGSLDSDKDRISQNNQKIFNMKESFEIKDLNILPFSIPHDAADPCGFNIYNNNQKLSIATDLGHVDSKTFGFLENSSSILIEANYDPEILKVSSYPYFLKRRISGLNGHLANYETGTTISKLINSGLKNALLVHLSKENNFPELAYKTVEEELLKNNYDCFCNHINIAPRNTPSPLFTAI